MPLELQARAARRLATNVAVVRAGARAPWGKLARELVGEAVCASGRSVAGLADAVGIAGPTLESYTKPSREEVPRGDVLLALLCRDDLVPEGAREGLLRRVCLEAGFFCIRLPERREELDGAVTALAEELGLLAAEVRRDEADGRVTGAELARIGGRAADLAARAMGLAAMCRESAGAGLNGTTTGQPQGA